MLIINHPYAGETAEFFHFGTNDKPRVYSKYIIDFSHFMEYIYLSDLTGDEQYRNRAVKMRQWAFAKKNTTTGLYPDCIDVRCKPPLQPETFANRHFFQSLLLSYIQSNYANTEALHTYVEAMEAMENNIMKKKSGGVYWAIRNSYFNAYV